MNPNYTASAPFWVGKDPRQSSRWVIFFMNKGVFFRGPGEGWKANEHAEAFAAKVNKRYVIPVNSYVNVRGTA
jgi:hypothetical protein